jgi:hypothetical protein
MRRQASFAALSMVVEQVMAAPYYTEARPVSPSRFRTRLTRGRVQEQAGICGGLLQGVGFFGALAAGYAVDRTRRYVAILRIIGVLILGAVVWWLLAMVLYRRFWFAIAATTAFSLTATATVPVVLEVAVECCWPVNETAPSAILMAAGSLGGLVIGCPSRIPSCSLSLSLFSSCLTAHSYIVNQFSSTAMAFMYALLCARHVIVLIEYS